MFAWRGERGAWWRFSLTCLAYFAGILVAAKIVAPWLRQYSFGLGGGELVLNAANVSITGAMYSIGLMAFLLAKRTLSPGRPSVLSFNGKARALSDACWSAVMALGLYAISATLRGQLRDIAAVLAAYSASELTIYLSLIAVTIGLQATSEEIVFRGYVLPRLAAWTTPLVAVVLSAVAFTGLHFGVSAWGYVAIVTFALAAAISVLLTGNIGAAVGLHAVNNVIGFAKSPHYQNGDVTFTDALSLVLLVLVWLGLIQLLMRRGPLQFQGRTAA